MKGLFFAAKVAENGAAMVIGKDADVVVETAAKDFNDYLITSMEIGGAITRKSVSP